ncbi:hypothetical protein ABWH96_20835 [Marivirga tractuosa]|uniref:hypothetical protein n=1 Tax=Marivirga tractuosa TaxID=1006 RepID=UPI0035CFB636
METQSIESKKTILLVPRDQFVSPQTSRKLFYISSFLFLVAGIFMAMEFFMEKGDNGNIVQFVFFILAGIFYFISAKSSYNKKLMPYFELTENGIKIKLGLFKNPYFIEWSKIRKIQFGPFKIGIKHRSDWQYFPYITDKKTSIQLKREIEQFAKVKNIEIENMLKRQ